MFLPRLNIRMIRRSYFMRVILKRPLYTVCTMCTVILLTGLWFGPVSARDNAFERLQEKLAADGFDPEKINALYQNPTVRFAHRSVSLFFMHSESRLNYNQFTSSTSIRKAKKYLRAHERALTRTERKYQVDREVITAIILVETRLGKMVGKSRVLNTLSTMAALEDSDARENLWQLIPADRRLSRDQFEKKADKKSGWAYTELKALLRYTFAEGIDPATIRGSYAGAMGICQFMPSNISRLAADGNNDGRIDLFNHDDAIASVANYLKHYGWKPGLSPKNAHKVIRSYNNSRPYADTILTVANLLRS
ncbi:MAG: protein MltB [Deltaproteobacteria bacterium]|nr:MAG: protein MltB [Deltaproteobacteria bacterium]